MAEILGLGCTHYPGLLQPDERLPGGFRHLLTAPSVPAHYKDRANWPDELLAELGNDDGVSSARRYGARMADDFRAIRKALDDFNPDLVLIWGDDQYENFREDIIPAFCVFGLDEQFALKPWHNGNGGRPNRWGEPGDWTMKLRGARDAAKHLATALIERGIDMAYAYKPLHVDGLAHAFTNTLLYLDWDRRGFPWPVHALRDQLLRQQPDSRQGRHGRAVRCRRRPRHPIRRRRSRGAAWRSATRSPRCLRNCRGAWR